MKKRKILVFIFFFLFILLINGLFYNFLSGFKINLFLGVLLFLFKIQNGLEKSKSRYIKTCILNLIIYLLSFFIIYYLSGLILGFVRTDNYFTLYGFTTFIINTFIYIILREILRYNLLTKGENINHIVIYTLIFFIILDLTNTMYYYNFGGKYKMFLFFSLQVLPVISNNILATLLSKRVGYKPSILFFEVIGLYSYIIPIVPNPNKYVYSIIWFLFPIIVFYREYQNFKKNDDEFLTQNYNKKPIFVMAISFIITLVLVYFTSGYFRYQAIVIASNSMKPVINKGDTVIIKKLDKNFETLRKDDVIAFKYSGVLVVHRIVNIIKDRDKLYIYTKGDFNKVEDSFVVEEEMIYGVVETKIPLIGYPTVWLNELQ